MKNVFLILQCRKKTSLDINWLSHNYLTHRAGSINYIQKKKEKVKEKLLRTLWSFINFTKDFLLIKEDSFVSIYYIFIKKL